MARIRLLPLLVCLGCGGEPLRFPTASTVPARLASLVPLRAVHLTGPEESPWSDYEPARADETRRSLGRLRALGARQVVVEAPYAWTPVPLHRVYEGVAAGNVVFVEQRDRPREEQYGLCQSGDLGLRPFRPPTAWLDGTSGVVVLPERAVSGMQALTGEFAALPVPTNPRAATPARASAPSLPAMSATWSA